VFCFLDQTLVPASWMAAGEYISQLVLNRSSNLRLNIKNMYTANDKNPTLVLVLSWQIFCSKSIIIRIAQSGVPNFIYIASTGDQAWKQLSQQNGHLDATSNWWEMELPLLSHFQVVLDYWLTSLKPRKADDFSCSPIQM